MNDSIGYVIGGGLKEGLRVRLTIPADQVQEGSFVVVDSGNWRYYGLITDLQLGSTDPRFADEKSDRMQFAISAALLGKTLFTTLAMYTTLMLDRGPEDPVANLDWQDEIEAGKLDKPSPRPVKTVPRHHADVRLADEADVAAIFEGDFVIGSTIEEPHHPIRIDLEKLVKRSSGIFGATGTGKSFLTRMVLAGVMKSGVASALVFDMHNEYAFTDVDADRGAQVLGMRDLFGNKVQVAALGNGTMLGSRAPDFTLQLEYKDITSADIQLLAGAINLNDSAAVVLDALESSFGENWFGKFMVLKPGEKIDIVDDNGKVKKFPSPDSVEFWADENNIHQKSATALHRKLKPIINKRYVVPTTPNDPVTQVVDKLENGRHVVLSFGEFESDLDYLLVSNILTRRIRDHWVNRMNEHKSNNATPPPKPLMIAIEEAHKLLNPHLAKQTAFGIIARELRKYNVTLLVVDQRPSGIDDEIMSQLGTRITGWLGDEDDIRAVLTGLAGRDQLRGMLARLQEKEEVLLLGWGVRMPIPIKSRRYDEDFYNEMRGGKPKAASSKAVNGKSIADSNSDLFG